MKVVLERTQTFKEQYARVNDITFAEQWNAVVAIVKPPLVTAISEWVRHILCSWGFTSSDGTTFSKKTTLCWSPQLQSDGSFVYPSVLPPPQIPGDMAYLPEGYLKTVLSEVFNSQKVEETKMLGSHEKALKVKAGHCTDLIKKVKTDAASRIFKYATTTTKKNISSLKEDQVNILVKECQAQITSEIKDSIRERYPPNTYWDYVLEISLAFDELGQPILKGNFNSSALRFEPYPSIPESLFEIETNFEKITNAVQKIRRAAFNEKLAFIELNEKLAFIELTWGYNSKSMFELQEKLSTHFGADAYVVYIRTRILYVSDSGFNVPATNENIKYSAIYFATFKTSKIWVKFWKICEPFSHGTKCAAIGVDGGYDDKNDTHRDVAFKDLRVMTALQKLEELFGESLMHLQLEL